MIRQVPWSEIPDASVGPRPRHAGQPRAHEGGYVDDENRRLDDVRHRAAHVVERVQGSLLPERLGRIGAATG